MGGLRKKMPHHLLDDADRRPGHRRHVPVRRLLGQGRDPRRRPSSTATTSSGSVGIVTAFITAIYMFRLIFLTFWGENRADAEVQHAHPRVPAVMTVPLVILAIPAALLGLVVGLPPEGGWLHSFLRAGVLRRRARALRAGPARAACCMIASLVIVARRHRHRLRGSTCAGPTLPARIAARVPWAYQASSQQVLHGRDLRRRAAIGATVIGFASWLWTFVDVKVIDGAVNGLAWLLGLARPTGCGRCRPAACRTTRCTSSAACSCSSSSSPGVWGSVTWAGSEQTAFRSSPSSPSCRSSACCSSCSSAAAGRAVYKVISLVVTLAAFVLSVVMLFALQDQRCRACSSPRTSPGSRRFNIHYGFGVDGIAALLVFLTTLLGVIVIIASWNYVKDRETRLLHLAAAARRRA